MIALRLRALAPLVLAVLASSSAFAADLPAVMGRLVKGAGIHPVERAEIGGTVFDTMKTYSEAPYLLWLHEADGAAPFEKDRDAVARWLDQHSQSFGHGALDVVFDHEGPWLGRATLWSYRLESEGTSAWSAYVWVLWSADRFIGIVNHAPGLVASVGARDPDVTAEQTLVARRLADGRVALERATVTRTTGAAGQQTTVQGPGVSFSTQGYTVAPPATRQTTLSHVWDEWPIPTGMGTFPDQIDTDSQGRVWFSQPSNDRISLFDPDTQVFSQYPSPVGGTPDGLIVASTDLVYSGLYGTGALGVYDPVADTFNSIAAPYSPAALAIPTETSTGTVVVTDHAGRIVEWDPASQQWIKDVSTISPAPHIVAGVEDEGGAMWFTLYLVDKLARLDLSTGNLTEIDIPIPGGGPAFPAYANGRIWFSLWNVALMGYFDPATHHFVFFQFPPNELGGPIFAAPNGDIACATRNNGWVMIYREQLGTVIGYPIPTGFSGIKDGLTIDAEGDVWITEGFADQIGRLKYPH